MTRLSLEEITLSNRIDAYGSRRREQTAKDNPPSLTDLKRLFEDVRRQVSRDNLTANLPRAVIQNTWQLTRPPREAWIEEFDNVSEIEFVCRWINHSDVVRPKMEAFFDGASRLDKRGQTDAALDIIFDRIDEMLLANEFDRVDRLLREIKLSDFSVDLLLGFLTATLPAKNQLSYRDAFFKRVEQLLHNRGEAQDGLLVGLD